MPVLTPYVSSLWLGLITPLYARIGRKLIESIVHSTVVRDPAALETFSLRPVGIEQAIRSAIRSEERESAETRWSDALSSSGGLRAWGFVPFGARLVDSRTVRVATTPDAAFAPVLRIGGNTGWYASNWLWRLRGYLDMLVGGIGMRRGRRSDTSLSVGIVERGLIVPGTRRDPPDRNPGRHSSRPGSDQGVRALLSSAD